MLSEDIKKKIKEHLVEKFTLDKIILFGSQARGTADSRSDVDLLIIKNELVDRFKFIREIRRSLLNFDYAFDIIAITPEEYERDKNIPGTISRYAFKEGIPIYGA